MNAPLPTLQQLSGIDRARAVGEFVAVAKHLLIAGGSTRGAAEVAEKQHAPRRVVEVLKAAIPAAGLGDSAWAGSLFSGLVAGFAESLKHFGAFDAMLPSMIVVPINARVGVVTGGFTASVVAEGGPKPIQRLSATAPLIEPQKGVAIVVVSDDFLRFAAAGTEQLLANELRAAVAVTVDTRFIEIITDGITPLSSSGTAATDVRADLRDMASAIATSVRSKLFLVLSAPDAKGLALMGDASGAAAFPQMTPQGGSIGGVQVVVSDGLAAGTAVMVDASGIAAASDRIELGVSREAALEMADSALNQAAITGSPATSAGTTLTPLFQSNSQALKATRYFGATRLRDDAVAVMSVNYSGSGSPA